MVLFGDYATEFSVLIVLGVAILWLWVVTARKLRKNQASTSIVLAVNGVFMFFVGACVWGSVSIANAHATELDTIRAQEQARIAAQSMKVQAHLGLNDWQRENLVFNDESLQSGVLIARVEGCRLEFDFTTNSKGEYTLIVGSGVLSDERVAIKPFELDDGTVILHSEEECKHIGQTWTPST